MNAKIIIWFFGILFSFQLAAQQDVGVSAILNPLSGCSVGTVNNPINVIVRNYSPSTAFPNTITVKYQVNGGTIYSQLVGTFLFANASYNFTFSQTQNLSACGQYNIKVWTVKSMDPNNSNDTLNYLFYNDCTPVPGTITGPSLVCSGSNSNSLTVTGGSYSYGYEWFEQTYPGPFIATGNDTNTQSFLNLTDSTTYNILYHGGLCPDMTSSNFGIGISPALNTGTSSMDLSLCADNIVGNVSIIGFTSSITDWEQSNNNGATWTSVGTNNTPLNINFLTDSAQFRAIIESGACGTGYSNVINVDVDPVIIPGTIVGASLLCSGTNSDTLVVTGHANQIGLEWYSSIDGITFSATGITNDTLFVSNLAQTTYYKVILFGNACGDSETPISIVNVSQPLNVGTLSSDLVLCANNISGSVSVSGYSSTILGWMQSDDNGVTWAPTGDLNAIHDISTLTANAKFLVLIGSGACGQGQSDTVSVTIEPTIVPGVISGGSTVCSGNNGDTLVLIGNANDFGFEWYTSSDNITFTASGITNDTLITNNLTQTTYYKVILQGNICSNAETNVESIIVDAPLNLGTISPNLFLCSDAITGSISVSGYTTTLMDWEQSDDAGLTWFSTGISTSSLDISYLTASADFRAHIEAGVCGNNFSDTISVAVESQIIHGFISGVMAVCSGSNNDTLVLNANANDFGFQWYSSIDNVIFVATGIFNDTLITSNLTQTTYYKVVLSGNYCADSETPVVTVQVDAPLNTGIASADLGLCANAVAGSVSLSGFASTILDWEQSNDGGVTWISTGDILTSHDISYLTASADFRAHVGSGACGFGYSDTISVVIESPIVAGSIMGATTVCSGTNNDTLVLSGNLNDFGFQWYSSTDNITYATTGNTNDTLFTNNLTQTTYYKVVLSGNYCVDSETPVVTVQVDAPLNTGIASADLGICANAVAGSVSLSGFASTILDWEQSNDGGVTWISTGDILTSHDISYLTASAEFRAHVGSGACGFGYSDTISVVIESPIVAGSIMGATTVCSGT
ncbi:MAG: hypothetical protein WC044_14400, partial [Crocinitomicaceae bacterium]